MNCPNSRVEFAPPRNKKFVRPEAKLLRLAGEVARRAGGVSHPRIVPHGKQNGHYGRRKGNKTAIMATAAANTHETHIKRRKTLETQNSS